MGVGWMRRDMSKGDGDGEGEGEGEGETAQLAPADAIGSCLHRQQHKAQQSTQHIQSTQHHTAQHTAHSTALCVCVCFVCVVWTRSDAHASQKQRGAAHDTPPSTEHGITCHRCTVALHHARMHAAVDLDMMRKQ